VARPPLQIETWGKIRRLIINETPTARAKYRGVLPELVLAYQRLLRRERGKAVR